MERKKTIQDLTIANEFMFGAVMEQPENCKELLEIVLGIEIAHIEVSKEKTMIYNPKYRGIRLDIYAKDANRTRYNVEMQSVRKPALLKRTRYYLSEIDMEILLSGESYKTLPDTYVIFVCDFDPFGKERYCYTRKQICKEVPELEMEDGAHAIFLSTHGTNAEEVPKQLVKFLEYVKAPLEESEQDFNDEYVSKLQKTVKQIKGSREMGAKYMTLDELLKDEREEGITIGISIGKAEAVLELLQDIGEVSEELRKRILRETDLEILRKWHKLAAKAETIEQFQSNM